MSFEAEIQDLRCSLAALAFEFALLRLRVLLRRGYDPDQPRVPAGNPDGGQWTEGAGGGGGLGASDEDSHVGDATDTRIAQNEEPRRYSPDLREHESSNGGIGHTIRRHVGRSDEDLVAEIEREWHRREEGTTRVTVWEPRVGSFSSIESANDFINRVLQANRSDVDAVANGRVPKKTLLLRFGFPTGREAYRSDSDDAVAVRFTYAVKVVIVHDPASKFRYGIRTAYPWNEDALNSRRRENYDDED
jgi:hypothetical protein